MNSALVFVKPHAVTDATLELVKKSLADNKIEILAEGEVTAETIDKERIIDRHYATIARYATEWTADQLTLSELATHQFVDKFGVSWADCVSQKKILNAAEASKTLGDITPEQLTEKWIANADKVKLAPGLYVCHFAAEDFFVLNGFYLRNREKFTAPGTKVHYYSVQWAEADLAWVDFRGKFVGPTDPEAAPEDSLRGTIKRDWEALGLAAAPTVSDNGVHASAGPLEGLAERMVWLSAPLFSDAFTTSAVEAGVAEDCLRSLISNPVVTLDGQTAPVFDILEDKQSSDVIQLLVGFEAPVTAADEPATEEEPSNGNTSTALVATAEKEPYTPPKNHISRQRRRINDARRGDIESQTTQLTMDEGKLRALFGIFDEDGTGFISREEFMVEYSQFESFGLVMSDSQLVNLFDKFDTRRDGKLSFDEFYLLMVHRYSL